MAESLREQLLKSGLVKPKPRDVSGNGAPAGKAAKGRRGRGGGKGRANNERSAEPARPARPRDTGEMNLAKAYAIRAQTEAEERKREQREAEARARQRREIKRRLNEALQGHTLNKGDAELMRHFEYGGKIRRVHVDAEQMSALNRGELGVIQQAGRYYIVNRARAEHIAGFAADHVALLVDPGHADEDDGVPDDLIW